MRFRRVLPLLLTLAVSALVPAKAEMRVPQEIVQSSHFLHWHPDLKFRRNGFLAWERGAHGEALERFRRAAWFGDKPSQAMLGEMHWKGEGMPQDRALAYAWMDLAAERGNPTFVGFREKYWAALTPAERERSVEVGQDLYLRYGDAVAKERMEHQLRKGRMYFTGSRASPVPMGKLTVLVPSPSGGVTALRGEMAYQKRMWAAKEYFEWQDEILGKPLIPRVELLPIIEDVPPPQGD